MTEFPLQRTPEQEIQFWKNRAENGDFAAQEAAELGDLETAEFYWEGAAQTRREHPEINE